MHAWRVWPRVAVAGWLAIFAAPLPAQTEKPSAGKAAQTPKPLDAAYVSDDFFAALVLHPARLLETAKANRARLDNLAAAVRHRTGIDPKLVEQVILLVPRPAGQDVPVKRRLGEKPPLEELPLAAIVRLREPAADKAWLARVAKTAGYGELEEVDTGKIYWRSTAGMNVACYAHDARTLVVAGEKQLRAMLPHYEGDGRLAERLRQWGGAADLLGVIEPDGISDALASHRKNNQSDWALAFAALTDVVGRVQSVQFTADLSSGALLHWDVQARTAADAELIHDLVRGWSAASKVLRLAADRQPRDPDDADLDPLPRSIRLADQMLGGLQSSRSGDRVAFHVEAGERGLDLLAAGAQLIGSVTDSLPRRATPVSVAQSSNNLRQLALAMHNFHDVYSAFPARASLGKDRKPRLSWRVHVLPFLEHTELYREFHLDEPWDSPHNKDLIAKMPDVFRSSPHAAEGRTSYVVPVGSSTSPRGGEVATIFPPAFAGADKDPTAARPLGLPLGSILDGSSNTLLILEVPAENSVIWTKPDDWEVDAKDPAKGLFGARRGFALAAFADASVHRLPDKTDRETLLRLLWRNDGMSVEVP
jgi:hypothetical protein